MKTLPTIEEIMNGNSTSTWLKECLASALKRDCVDVYFDALFLAEILHARMRGTLVE